MTIKHSMDKQEAPDRLAKQAVEIKKLKKNLILLAAYEKSIVTEQIRWDLNR